MPIRAVLSLLTCLLLGAGTRAMAASLTVITTLNIRPALARLVTPYERASGDRVLLQGQPATATRRRIERGDQADVVIHDRAVIEALARQGRIRPNSIVDIARSSIALIVSSTAALPDVSSDARLRAVLLAAPSLTYPDPAEGSIGGNYLARLFAQWGLTDALKPKLVLAGGGAAAGKIVSSGRAAIGLNQTAELLGVPGIRFVTVLPPALRDVVVMSAGVVRDAAHPEAARRWIAWLASPAAAEALRSDAMDPSWRADHVSSDLHAQH